MAKKNYGKMAKEIFDIIGKENISNVDHCITRLRLTVEKINKEKVNLIKRLDYVLGIQEADSFHIILGTGIVEKVYDEFIILFEGKKIITNDIQSNSKVIKLSDFKDLKGLGNKLKNMKLGKRFVATMQNTFSPIISLLIGVGIVLAFSSILQSLGVNPIDTSDPNLPIEINFWPLYVLQHMAMFLLGALPVFVGYTSAKYFKTNVIWGIGLGLFTSYGLTGIPNLGLVTYENGMGGILGVIFGTYIFSLIDKFIDDALPETIQFILSSAIILIVGGLIYIAIILPVFGILMYGVSEALVFMIGTPPSDGLPGIKGAVPIWVAGFVLSFTHVFAIIFGLAWPIYAVLLANANATNSIFLALYPVIIIVDMAIYGIAFAISLKTRNKQYKKISKGASIAAISGVTEPTLYGFVIPNPKLFIPVLLFGTLFGTLFSLMNPYMLMAGPMGFWGIFIIGGGTDVLMMGVFALLGISATLTTMIFTMIFFDKLVSKDITGESIKGSVEYQNSVIDNMKIKNRIKKDGVKKHEK